MKNRFNLVSVVPQAYIPLFEFDKILADTELDHIQREMIKIRTSQLNGCAYCLNARKGAEPIKLTPGKDGASTSLTIPEIRLWEMVVVDYSADESL